MSCELPLFLPHGVHVLPLARTAQYTMRTAVVTPSTELNSDFPSVPAQGGFLPYFILFGSTLSMYNTIQSHFLLHPTRTVYSNKPHEGA